MSTPLPTVHIAVPGDAAGRLINQRDFDPDEHTLFGEAEDGSDEPSLADIKGIGPATLTKLVAREIETFEALADAVPADVAEITGASEAKATAWVEAAKKMATEDAPNEDAPNEDA